MSGKEKELRFRVTEERRAIIESVLAKRGKSIQAAVDEAMDAWIGPDEMKRTREYLGFDSPHHLGRRALAGAKS